MHGGIVRGKKMNGNVAKQHNAIDANVGVSVDWFKGKNINC